MERKVATCKYQLLMWIGLKPQINIFNVEKFELVQVLSGGSSIEFKDLCFSRDGKYLISLGSVPDRRIAVFEVETGKL